MREEDGQWQQYGQARSFNFAFKTQVDLKKIEFLQHSVIETADSVEKMKILSKAINTFAGSVKDIEQDVQFEVNEKDKNKGEQVFRIKKALQPKQPTPAKKTPSPIHSTKGSSDDDSDDNALVK